MSYHCFLPVFSGAGLDGFRLGWSGWIQTGLVWMGAGRRVQGAGFRVQGRRVQGRRAQGAGRRAQGAGAQGRRVAGFRGAGGKNFGQNVLGVATKKAPPSFSDLGGREIRAKCLCFRGQYTAGCHSASASKTSSVQSAPFKNCPLARIRP